jgi:hypothetical protein
VTHYFDCVFKPLTNQFPSSSCPLPVAYNSSLRGLQNFINPSYVESFRVIFDSGCSLAISPNRENFIGDLCWGDFIGDLRRPIQDLRLGGMANGMLIEGIGVVEWSFESSSGATVTIKTECYYVPASKVRLISPQRLFNSSQGISGEFICREG